MNAAKLFVAKAGMVIAMLALELSIQAGHASTVSSIGFCLQLEDDTRTIQVTPEYKEAALKASLPLISEFAQKLRLPVPYPLTRADITDSQITPVQKKDGEIDHLSIETRQGYSFSVYRGIVRGFSSPNAYSAKNNSANMPDFFGPAKITREQAIEDARTAIRKIGISLEDIFAEQEPVVTVPTWWTNTIARYMIEWHDPRGSRNSLTTAKIEVNAVTGQIEYLWLLPINGLQNSALKVAVIPPAGRGMFDSMIPPPMSTNYAWKLIPIMFDAVETYAKKLSLPISYPLTTNSVAKIEAHNNDGWPACEIWLTNGWHFVYRHAMVNGFYSPDNFFDSDNRHIHISDFNGRWNLTTNQAIEIVRQAMKTLNYPTNNVHMDFIPNVYVAAVDKGHIPRLRFEWFYSVQDELKSRLEAEVNMDNGKLESLYYDDKAYWSARPPIDVPITISGNKVTSR